MKKISNRREFLAGIVRGGLIGGLIGGGAALVKRNGIDKNAHSCSGGGICSACRRAGQCVLPSAVSRRQSRRVRV